MRLGVLIGLAAVLGACRSDADRLARALDPATGREEGLGLCAALADPASGGVCALAVMQRAPGLDRAGCDALPQPLWRHECHFRRAEQLAEGGDLGAGLQACHLTRYGRECSFHLIRAQARLAATEDAGAASARLPTLDAGAFTPDYARLFWRERFRAGQALGRTAALADCGLVAEPTPCDQAWRELWAQALLALGQQRLCARVAAGGPILTLEGTVPAYAPGKAELDAVQAGCTWAGRDPAADAASGTR